LGFILHGVNIWLANTMTNFIYQNKKGGPFWGLILLGNKSNSG
jgi:hypothetical protein